MPNLGLSLGIPFSKTLGSGLNCSTKAIMSAFKARLISNGVSVGAMKCSSLLVNSYTSDSPSECYLTRFKLRLQADGVVTGPMSCTLNLIKQYKGE